MRPSPERSAIVPFTPDTRMAPSPLEARTFAACGTETIRRALQGPNQLQACARPGFTATVTRLPSWLLWTSIDAAAAVSSRMFFDDNHYLRPIPRLHLDGAIEGRQHDVGCAFDGESFFVALGGPPGIRPGHDTAGKRHAERESGQQEGATGNHGWVLREP